MSWIDDLKKKYNFCSEIDFIPFPSAAPELFVGYALWCKKRDKELDDNICQECKEKHL